MIRLLQFIGCGYARGLPQHLQKNVYTYIYIYIYVYIDIDLCHKSYVAGELLHSLLPECFPKPEHL